MFKLPSLTELFFGKGVDPATYAPAYLSGKGKKQKKEATAKKVDISKAITKEKPIKEVTKATSKTGFETRGTRKDYSLQKKKSTANYRAGKI